MEEEGDERLVQSQRTVEEQLIELHKARYLPQDSVDLFEATNIMFSSNPFSEEDYFETFDKYFGENPPEMKAEVNPEELKALNVRSVVRFLNRNDKIEGNTKIITWSDGKQSLAIGENLYDIDTLGLGNSYLYSVEGPTLTCQAIVQSKWSCSANTAEDEAHRYPQPVLAETKHAIPSSALSGTRQRRRRGVKEKEPRKPRKRTAQAFIESNPDLNLSHEQPELPRPPKSDTQMSKVAARKRVRQDSPEEVEGTAFEGKIVGNKKRRVLLEDEEED